MGFVKIIILLFLFTLLCGCEKDIIACDQGINKTVSEVIFSEIESSKLGKEYPFLMLGDKFWTPTKADIDNIKTKFVLLEEELKPEKSTSYNLCNYNKQYLGIYDDLSKAVYLNLYCTQDRAVVADEAFVVIFDGGNCYLQARYNLDEEKFYNIEVNPES